VIKGVINFHVNLSKKLYPLIIVLAFVVTGIALNEAKETKVLTDYHSVYFPDTPGMRETRIFESEFIGTRWVDILIEVDRAYINDVLDEEVLKMTEDLVDIVSASPGVFSISSVLDLGKTREEILAAPSETRHKFVNRDMRYSLIRLTINDREAPDNARLYKSLQGTVDKVDVVKGSKVILGGSVGIEYAFDKAFRGGLKDSIKVSILMVTLVLFLVFKSPTTALAIMVPVFTAVSIAFGVMNFIDIPINMLTVLFGAVTIGLAVDYGIHIIHRYREEERKGNEIALNTAFTLVGRNTVFTALTTIAVFSSMLFSKLRLVTEYGIMSFIAIGFALLTVMFFMPSFLLLEKKIGRREMDLSWLSGFIGAENFLRRIVTGLTSYALKRPFAVVVFVLLAFMPMFYGMSTLKTSHDTTVWLPENDPITMAHKTVNKEYGLTEYTFIMIKGGDIREGRIVETMAEIAGELRQLPYARRVTSISDFVDLSSYKKTDITNLPLEIQDQLVTPTYTEAIIILESDSELGMDMTATSQIEEIIERASRTDDAEILQVGMMYLHTQTAPLMQETRITTTIISLVLVAILLYIALGSGSGIIIGILPLVTAIVFAMGTMGLFGIQYSILTILLATILLGLGIDYSIHFLARYREELGKDKTQSEALMTSANTVGESIAITSITTMFGFLSLLSMSMPPVKEFGVITALGLLYASILVPTLITAGLRIQDIASNRFKSMTFFNLMTRFE